MPHINRIRLVNVNFNDAKGIYDDFMMDFGGKSATYDLMNTGGKSLLLLMLLQTVVPNTYLKKEKPLKNIFIGGNTKRTSHCLVEWILDEGSEYRYLLTGFCARKKQVTEEEASEEGEKLEIDYYNYCYLYNQQNKNDIKHFPLTERNGEEKIVLSYDKLKQYLNEMKKEKMPAEYFFNKREYMKYIEYFGLISAEWKLISEINVSENYIEKYFKENKTSRKLIENFLIKIIDNITMQNNQGIKESEDLAEALINIKDNLMKFQKESDNKKEYMQTKELFVKLAEIANQFEEQFEYIKRLNQKTNDSYQFQSYKMKENQEKIEKEKIQIEDLEKQAEKLIAENKKLEIDALYIQKDKLEKQKEDIVKQLTQISSKSNDILKQLKLSKAQNEYIQYKENKNNMIQKEIQISKKSLNEGELQKQYNLYGYYYKKALEEKIKNLNKELEVLKIKIDEAKKDKKEAEISKNSIEVQIGVIKNQKETLETELSEREKEENTISQELMQEGLMDQILDLENGIQEIEQLKTEIIEIQSKDKIIIDNLKREIDKNEKSEIEKKGKIERLELQLDLANKRYDEYEVKKQEINHLIKIFNVQNIEELISKLKMQKESKTKEKNSKEIEKQYKQRKLNLIEKYNIIIPNEDIFYLKEKLINKCAHVTTGIEELAKIKKQEREEILEKNPWYVYSIFIDEKSFYQLKKQQLKVETEGLVPIANIEILREKQYETKEDNILYPIQKELHENIGMENTEKFKQKLKDAILTSSQRIIEDEAEENRLRKLLDKIEEFLNKYTQNEIENLEKEVTNIQKEIADVKYIIKDMNRVNQNYKDEIEDRESKNEEQQKEIQKLNCYLELLTNLKNIKNELQELKEKKKRILNDEEDFQKIYNEKIYDFQEKENLLENLTNEFHSKSQENEKINGIFKELPEFKEVVLNDEILNQNIEQIENQYKALDKRINSTNSELKDLKENYNLYKNAMKKCEDIIIENDYTISYFENKTESITKVLNTYIDELNENLKSLEIEKKEIEDREKDIRDKISQTEGKIQTLIEQLENSTYNLSERNQDLDKINYIVNENKQKVNIYKNKEKELKNKISGIENEIRLLEAEINRLDAYISQYQITKNEVDTNNFLENEIYSYKKIIEHREKITKEIQKLETKWDNFIRHMQEEIKSYCIQSDIREVLENIKKPTNKQESTILKNGIEQNIDLIEQKIENIEKSLKSLSEYQEKFIYKCYEKSEVIVRDLNKLPGLSRIKIGGKDISIIKLDLYEYEKEEKLNRIKQYIENIVKEMENNPELMDRSKLNEKLSSKSLVAQVANLDRASVKLYKVEDILEHSTYKRWEDDLGSDGQVNAIYFMFAVCIISYISMLTRVEVSHKSRKVIIADNPFGATSAVFLWDVMFSILKENNVQLIAPGHNISKEIISKFEVNYILKHEYYNGNKKSVVVDKELRAEQNENMMEFNFLEGTQQSMF